MSKFNVSAEISVFLLVEAETEESAIQKVRDLPIPEFLRRVSEYGTYSVGDYVMKENDGE